MMGDNMNDNYIAIICNALFFADYGQEVKDVTHYANGYFIIHFADGSEIELQEVKR